MGNNHNHNKINNSGNIETSSRQKSIMPQQRDKNNENQINQTSRETFSTDFRPKTEDEESKERKKRKRELIAGAIGDMGSAFANLFFTTQGAPSSISTTGKNREPTLMERIKSRHKEEDNAYGKQLSAWDKEREKKRKEAERIAKENEREDIHADFRPLKSHWNDKEYVAFMYEDLIGDITNRNKAKGKETSKLYENLQWQTKNIPARALPYLQQSILYDILDGSLESFDMEMKGELDEEFLSNFRNKWRDNDSAWTKMK